VSLSLIAVLLAGAGPAPTVLEPAISAPDGASCRFQAKGPAEHEGAGPITLEPGEYRVAVRCDVEHGVLAPAPITVRVPVGKTTRPRVRVDEARVRIESRRSGELMPAFVDVFPRHADLNGPPLVRVPTNRTVSIAGGAYDLLVTLADDDAPRAEVLLSNVRLSKGRKRIVRADLSDGGLVVSIQRDGRRTDGSTRAFLPGSKRDVGLASAGEELRLSAGRYEILTELQESFDYATKRRQIWVRPRKVTRVTEKFDTGRLTVKVTADGAAVPAIVRVAKPGAADFFNYFEAPETVTLSPGIYDLTVQTEAAGPLGKRRIPNVVVNRRQLTRKSLDLTRGTLIVRVLKNGRPVTFAEVIVRAAGGGAPARPEADGSFRLWPGRYEIEATLESGAKTTDGPFEIGLGQRLTRSLTLDRAFVTVTARRGKKDVDAKVFVYKHGATKPLAQALTGERIELDPGTYDLKVVAGPDARWKQNIRLKRAHAVTVELATDAHAGDELPEGELPDGDAP
jgi:hypothetical protein